PGATSRHQRWIASTGFFMCSREWLENTMSNRSPTYSSMTLASPSPTSKPFAWATILSRPHPMSSTLPANQDRSSGVRIFHVLVASSTGNGGGKAWGGYANLPGAEHVILAWRTGLFKRRPYRRAGGNGDSCGEIRPELPYM